jgi:hypothetical protein
MMNIMRRLVAACNFLLGSSLAEFWSRCLRGAECYYEIDPALTIMLHFMTGVAILLAGASLVAVFASRSRIAWCLIVAAVLILSFEQIIVAHYQILWMAAVDKYSAPGIMGLAQVAFWVSLTLVQTWGMNARSVREQGGATSSQNEAAPPR